MNCENINRAIIEGSTSPLTPEAGEHLRTCAKCRELVGALKLAVPTDLPSSAVFREIERGLVADLRPVRPIAPKRYIFVSLMAIFIVVAVLSLSRFRAFAIAAMTPLQTGAIFGALAISAGLLAYSLVNQMVPGSRYRFPPGKVPLAVTILLMVSIAALFPFYEERSFWFGVWVCIRGGIPVAAFAAVPLWLVLRRGAILSPIMTATAMGLLAGLAGTTALEIHCPNLAAWHILASHLGVALIAAIVGLVVGWAVENWKLIIRP
jgi:hypothetical protein